MRIMRIFITGITGLLGKSLVETAGKHVTIVGTHLGNCDLKDDGNIHYRVLDVRDEERNARLYDEFRPDVTIHTAGVGSPDYAERHKEETRDINVRGTQNIRKNCEKFRSAFIYISSNGIYDGSKAPYREEDEARPINYYGQIKLEGERISGGITVRCAVVRPMLLYGWNHSQGRKNIVTYALSKLGKGEKVFAYDDVFVNPVFAPSCAGAIWKIIEGGKYEAFNIGGKDTVSIYRLVKSAAGVFDLDPGLVVPVRQGFFNELVKRPRDTSYNTDKMREALGIEPVSLEEGLCLMKRSARN